MNKKFLSAILFGALMVTSTGTFVSCKDYDDDIENLQGQVDATKSDLATKVSALESSISSLQSAQSSLDSKIASTKDAAEKAALEAQAAAIAAAKADLEAAVAELKSAHDADIAEVEAAIATIKGNVEALQAFQGTTEETLEALAAADEKLAGALTELEADVVANATAIGKLEAAIDAQIKALEAYEASNDEAVAANKTAIDAVAADLKKLQDTVAGLKIADPEGLEEAAAAIAEAQGEIAKLSTAVQEINGKLELISSAVYTGVTHVSLVTDTEESASTQLNFVSVEAVTDYVFGQNLPGAVTFVKGNVETFERDFMIRVSPTNANLDASMIKIVDSQLNEITGLVDIVELKPVTGLLAGSRAISTNGLWNIRMKLQDNFDMAAYNKAAKKNGDYIKYAVMVNNTAVAERQVVSEYGITLGGGDKYSRYDLDYQVKSGTWYNVADIKNRYSGDATTTTENGGKTSYQEAVWNLKNTYKAISHTYVYDYAPFITPNWAGFNAGSTNINVVKAGKDMDVINPSDSEELWSKHLKADIRNEVKALRVDAETPFVVRINTADEDHIRAFYVTLDAENAVESAPSELVAWQSYDIEGLNEVVDGNSELALTIPAKAYGDYIGFRVYAVNYDGTLVDPDGRAFYVYVGEQTTVSAELTLSMTESTKTSHTYIFTPWAEAYEEYVTNGWGRAVGGTYEITFSADNDVDGDSGNGIQYYADGATISSRPIEDKIYNAINASNFDFKNNKDVSKIILKTSTVSGMKLTGDILSITDDPKAVDVLNSIANIGMKDVKAVDLRDGVTYYAHITIKGANAQVIGKSTIAFKKELPGFPANVAPATGMLQNGNVMVFPWEKSSEGYAKFDMDGAFEGLSDALKLEDLSSPNINGYRYTESNSYVVMPLDFVDPSNDAYATEVPVRYVYNYGNISNPYDANLQTWKDAQPWKTYYPFTLQFGNYFQETEMTLTPFTITYPGAKDKEYAIELSNIEIRDWYNQVVDLKNAQGNVDGTKEGKYLSKKAEIHFVTENSAKPIDEYYEFVGFGKAQYRADGTFKGYAKENDTFYVFNENGEQIRKYTLTLEDLDVMIIKSVKDSFTGGTVPTWIKVVYTDNFGKVIEKKSENSFTMNFQQ